MGGTGQVKTNVGEPSGNIVFTGALDLTTTPTDFILRCDTFNIEAGDSVSVNLDAANISHSNGGRGAGRVRGTHHRTDLGLPTSLGDVRIAWAHAGPGGDHP